MNQSVICKCGTQATYHQFQNFSYHFCSKCKVELKAKLPTKPGMEEVIISSKLNRLPDIDLDDADLKQMNSVINALKYS